MRLSSARLRISACHLKLLNLIFFLNSKFRLNKSGVANMLHVRTRGEIGRPSPARYARQKKFLALTARARPLQKTVRPWPPAFPKQASARPNPPVKKTVWPCPPALFEQKSARPCPPVFSNGRILPVFGQELWWGPRFSLIFDFSFLVKSFYPLSLWLNILLLNC